MICAIMQPTFMPWVGYFDLIDSVDKFVFLDDVQLTKRSWQVRNRIKTVQGELYITLPIKKSKHRNEEMINSAKISNFEWVGKTLKTIQANYKKSSCFGEVYPFIEVLLNSKKEMLSDFNSYIILEISKKIGIQTEFLHSSILSSEGIKDELLSNICLEIGADMYLSPQGSAIYIEEKNAGGAFSKQNIELYYHDYNPISYPQLHGDFIPYMGIFDLLLNVGFEDALNMIRSGRKEKIYFKNYKGVV